jgi:hypothetical protein
MSPDAGLTAPRLCARTLRSFCPTFSQAGSNRGRVFDRFTNLDGAPDGYRAMNEREAIKEI